MSFQITKTSTGKMSWKEFENPRLKIKKGLVFDITVPITYKIGNTESSGSIRLDFIRVHDIKLKTEGFIKRKKYINWSEFENKTYSFPVNPTPGYIDGSFYLMRHNPCDIIKIEFKKLVGNMLKASLTGWIDFEYEKMDKEAGVKKYEFKNLDVELETK